MHDDTIRIAEIQLTCRHCGRQRFFRWGGAGDAVAYACTNCGHMQWFLAPVGADAPEGAAPESPEEPEDPQPAEEAAPIHHEGVPAVESCVACGTPMRAGEIRCTSCGIRYVETGPAKGVPPPLPKRTAHPRRVRRPSPGAAGETGASEASAGPVEPTEPAPAVEPGEPPQPDPAPEPAAACPKCGATRRGRTSICHACGSLYTDA